MAYNKTTWENAPSTNTPINANNLNKIEEGIYQNSLKADQVGDLSELETIEKQKIVEAINEVNNYPIKPTILYDNSTGAGGNITLLDSIENYEYYEIYYSRGGSTYSSIKMSTEYLSNIDLSCILYAGDITRIYTSNISISGTNLTRNYTRYLNISNSGSINTGNDAISIYKVIGYK